MSGRLARFSIALVPRPDPLPPRAVAAAGAVASRLARRLLLEDDATLCQLEGVRSADGDVVVVRGATELLPWVDGACWLAEAAPGLFLPTRATLNAPLALAHAALERHLPLALLSLDGALCRVPLARALPLTREIVALVAR